MGKELGKAGEDAGKTAGDGYTGTFRESLRKGLAAAQRELNTTPLKLALNDEGLRKSLDKVRTDFAALDKQVKLGMDASGSLMELRRILSVLDDVQKKAQNVEVRSNVGKVHRDLAGIEAHIQKLSATDIEPQLKIDRQLGLFERRLKAGIASALNDLPPLKIDDGPAYAQVEALRERMLELDHKIDLGMDASQAFAELAAIESAMGRVADESASMDLRVNAAGALKTVAGVRTELESLSRITIEPELQLDRQLGAFERGFKGAIQNALRDLGPIGDAPAGDPRFESAGQRAVRDLRQNLFDLGDLEIGVDISAETAREELRRIRDELERLQREHWDVRIDADSAAASAQISGFLAALEAIDHEDIDVDVELKGVASAIAGAKALRSELGQTDSVLKRLSGSTQDGANSFRAFNARVLGVAALGPLVVPALGAIGAGVAALGPLAAAGAAGLGVLALGLFGVGDAFKAMGEARVNGASDAQAYERSVRQAASSVADAERGVADARESAARSSEAAGRQVEDALRGVVSAERNYRSAVQDSQRAQDDLTRARADAAEQMEDLSLSVRGGALAERDAVLDLREAEETLAQVREEGLAGDELDRYILKVDQARFNLDRTRESNEDLRQESDEWAKSGIEGSDGVVAAHERVQQAQERIADAERGMADAQRALGDARAEQARAAVDGQKQIADAQRSLSEAQIAYSEALAETSTSQRKLNEEMANLGPAGQDFVRYLDGLRPRLQELRSIAQQGMLPGLREWIDSMVTFHGPLLERTIGNISGAVGRMFSSFGESIRGEAFTDLFEMINSAGPSFIRMMGDVLRNLGEGVARLIVATEPLSRLFGEWLVNATARFNEWASSLRGSTGLQEFFMWVERVGPKVADFFWELGDAIRAIAVAVAPFAERMLEGLTDFLDWVSELDPNVLGPIVIGIATLTVALQAIFGLTALIHSFRSALHLTTGALGAFSSGAGGVKGAAGGFAILGTAMVTLYTQSEAVRNIINDVVEAIADLVGWATSSLPGLTTLASTLAIVAASFKGMQVIGGVFSRVGTAVGDASGRFGQLVYNMTGSVDAGVRTMGTMDKVGGALTKVGGALPLVGLGVGLLGAAFEASSRKIEENRAQLTQWLQAQDQGGAVGAEATRNLDRYRDRVEAARERLAAAKAATEGVAGATEGASTGYLLAGMSLERLEKDLRVANDEYERQKGLLTETQLAQAEVTAAQANLQLVLKDHAPTSDEARAAAERLETAERNLAIVEGQLELAVSGVNQELLTRQGIAIDTAKAQMTYEQSVNALKDAHQRYLDVMADPNHTEEQARQALEAWHNQAMATAESAKALALAKYADADANVRQEMGNAALLASLEEQKRLYGDLPPHLETLRQSLADTVPESYKIAAGFDNLGLAIARTPDTHTIVLESATDEEIIKMQELGLVVERGANGEVTVTANTDAAREAIEALTAPRTMEIWAEVQTGIAAARKSRQTYDQLPGRTYFGQVPEYASGGAVFGPGTWTSDSIPAYLSNGEFVVRAASVAKYGLPLLDAINQGNYQGPTPAFATGGLVRSRFKNGRPAFADGGFIASYGGTINLSGAAIPELAGWWVDALTTINDVSAQAATGISTSFARLRQALLGNFSDTHTQATSIWGSLFATITGQANGARGLLGMIFGGIRDDTTARSTETRDTQNSLWGQIRDLLFSRGTETRDRQNSLFGQMRDLLFGRSSEARDQQNGLFGQMRDWMGERAYEAVQRVSGHFSGLPSFITGPINTIIDKVMNNGLFKAFNAVVGALGLDEKLKIPTVDPVKLAVGGRVPGYSPHDKADNVPAMLTAGEWVQPVDAVRYYGPEVMEALRKKRIPREFFGRAPEHHADGGPVGWRALQSAVLGKFPWARITSTVRPGDPGYHGKGLAIDIGGARPYPDPTAIKQMLEINRWIAGNFANITELIHTQPGAVNLWHGQPHTYSKGTQAEHKNHVHWAMAAALQAGSGILGTLGDMLGVATDAISDPVGFLRKAVTDALGADFDTVPVKKIMGQGSLKLVDLMADKVTGLLGGLFGAGDDVVASKQRTSGNAAANEQLAQQMAAARGWTGGQWTALRNLWMKESGFNNLAQNPTSTAYGIPQFLNGTWGTVGIAKTSDPRMQIEAGLRYIANRYQTPAKAWAHSQATGWYHEGGLVRPNQDVDSGTGAIVPDLHDTGGWVMPGLNVLMNRTNRPEPVINPQTLDALISIASQGSAAGAAAIGTLEQNFYGNTSAREVAGEVDHVATVARRGGKY